MTSGGGGYCDCGDPEAWKQFPCCEIHTPRSSTVNDSKSFQSIIEKLPQDLVQRATELFKILIQYVSEILGVDGNELPMQFRSE